MPKLLNILFLSALCLLSVSPLYSYAAGGGDKAGKEIAPDDMELMARLAHEHRFEHLIEALEAAELTQTLTEGELTIFAPTDEAFERLPEGVLEDWLKPENKEELQKIMKHHIVKGKVSSHNLSYGITQLETFGRTQHVFRNNAGALNINGVDLNTVNIRAKNALIHAADHVFIPGETPQPIPVEAPLEHEDNHKAGPHKKGAHDKPDINFSPGSHWPK